ncbi:MAG: hypoxanthine phosphoribosyltransferase [Defluviitaleaceae bacterium]|nr:hypoxanthine phosphoribosyltransferase [Defluviitaleaceae bacterium]
MKETISILISEDAIRERIESLATEINRDYEGKNITLVCALKGAMIFMADLSRRINSPVDFDFIGASSYDDGTTSKGKVRLTKSLDYDPSGKHILLIEDILDTGHTLAFIRKHILSQDPASFKVCCLLDKPERRVVSTVEADYTGFTIPDSFVVGYGLDYAQRYRNLPYIGVLNIEN